jgi:hypothetical protein
MLGSGRVTLASYEPSIAFVIVYSWWGYGGAMLLAAAKHQQ